MKKEQYSVSINNPCSQNWNNMKTNELGKFCSSCEKTVVDFTVMSDNEIITFLEKSQSNICGRLSKPQLNKILVQSEKRNASPRLIKLLFSLLFLSTAQIGFSQAPNLKTHTEQITLDGTKVNCDKMEAENYIRGTVYDKESGEPLPFANVYLLDFKVGISTEFDGSFNLEIPNNIKIEEDQLIVSYVGYEKFHLPLSNTQLPLVINPELEPSTYTLGMVVGLVAYKKSPVRKLKYFFRKIFRKDW